MAKVKIQGHASGTGVITVTAPNTSTDRTITLPDSTGTLATTADSVGGANGVDFNDSIKARFGTGNDLEIYHDGTHSYIKDVGTGDLRIKGTDLSLRSDSADEPYINCTENGSVSVFHNNSKKLETTATGLAVTGFVSTTVAPYWETLRDDSSLGSETFTYGASGHHYWVTFTSTNATADMFIYGGRLHSGQWHNYGWKFGNEAPATFSDGTTVSDTNNTYQMSWAGGSNQITFSRSSGSTAWGIHVKAIRSSN